MNSFRVQSGMTLVEMVISIVLISIAVTAVLSAFSTTMGRSSDSLWKNKSLKLAQLYLDEILSKKYDSSTPLGGVPASTTITCPIPAGGGGNRALYDNVDDYNGINDSPPKLVSGALANYTGYSVQVSVACAGNEVGIADNSKAKRITVSITPPNQSPMPFSVYRGNY
ncbi:type IV pilus modification PilV family protein [Alkalimarinus alittae]|uniref:Type II secretion system GspH family protein n=1 Tax=Alkalimarinus alittae TaxID=2961619 RepID=A0ABY6N123_9ALTE|nr:type II secretion system protein [Alkalimarinus alittae]UZE95778.1 type II secretion system GspH family protein [Alkalimarinus alittae]